MACSSRRPSRPSDGSCCLPKFEETLDIGGEKFDLSVNRYSGAVYPHGHLFLKEFRLDPFPVFTYEVEGVEIEKRVFMLHGENTTVVEYELRGSGPPCSLEIRPLIAFRDFHCTTHHNDALNRSVEISPEQATVAPYPGLPPLHFAHNASDLRTTGRLVLRFRIRFRTRARARFPGGSVQSFRRQVHPGKPNTATIIASTELHNAAEARAMRRSEIERRACIIAASPSADPFVQDLVAAADQFIVKRGDLKTIIAGYPWFSDWGRDAMIALPGLTLVTGKVDVAKSILLAFAASVDRGMLPNCFPDAGEACEYNDADATLWFFEAIRALWKHTGDAAFVREHFYDCLKDIVDWHMRGTRYGIRADADGLL